MFSLVTTLSLALALSDYARGASVPSSRQYDELAGESVGDDQVVRTPGKLRVTENSGVCGMHFLFPIVGLCIMSTDPQWMVQKLHLVFTRLLDMETLLRTRVFGTFDIYSVGYQFITSYTRRFWFFESRNNAETDPLVVWFNGGVCISPTIFT